MLLGKQGKRKNNFQLMLHNIMLFTAVSSFMGRTVIAIACYFSKIYKTSEERRCRLCKGIHYQPAEHFGTKFIEEC